MPSLTESAAAGLPSVQPQYLLPGDQPGNMTIYLSPLLVELKTSKTKKCKICFKSKFCHKSKCYVVVNLLDDIDVKNICLGSFGVLIINH